MTPVKTLIRRSKSLYARFQAWAALALAGLASAPGAYADLPTQVPPHTNTGAAPGNGDWLNLILGYIADAGKVAGLAIAVAGFLYVSYSGYQKFNEARTGRGEWGEVIVLAIVGAALLLLSSFLLNESAGVITGSIA